MTSNIHVFSDASERAYGTVAYLCSEDAIGGVHMAFLLARSRVAPKRQQSMPILELCVAVTGAQLVKLVVSELTLPGAGIPSCGLTLQWGQVKKTQL